MGNQERDSLLERKGGHDIFRHSQTSGNLRLSLRLIRPWEFPYDNYTCSVKKNNLRREILWPSFNLMTEISWRFFNLRIKIKGPSITNITD